MKPRILALLLALLLLCGCAAPQKAPAEQPAPEQPAAIVTWDSLTFDRALPLSYAEQFTVSYAGEDYTRITIGEDQTFLLVAEGAPVPAGVPEDVTVLQQPLDHIYLVATAAMDFFRALDAVDRIALSGQKESDWYIDEAKAAMQAGTMVYAGKYSAPDYETILAEGCDLAIENTMIYHTPEVVEQLESVGVPVLIERSSYESDPLGRIEWLKLYGALVGKEDAACAAYDALLQDLQPVLAQEPAGKTVAFFYITTSRRGQRAQIRRLYRQGHPDGGRRLRFVRRERRGKRPLDHDHPDGIVLRRRGGRGRAHLQQHHRWRAGLAGRSAGQKPAARGLPGRADR